jgi:hypothetical protein
MSPTSDSTAGTLGSHTGCPIRGLYVLLGLTEVGVQSILTETTLFAPAGAIKRPLGALPPLSGLRLFTGCVSLLQVKSRRRRSRGENRPDGTKNGLD